MDEEFPAVVEKKNVNGAMPKLSRMDFAAGCSSNHPVGLIHDIEDLLRRWHRPMKT